MQHIQLAATDLSTSIDFYCRYFGFERPKRGYDSHILLRNTSGLLLALIRCAEPVVVPDWLHIGFPMKSAEQVWTLYGVMQADGIQMHRDIREGDSWVAFYSRDPTGIIVEVSWDQQS